LGWSASAYHVRDEYIDVGSIVPRPYLMTRMLTELGSKK
jgi:glutamate carboxypeptidase